MVHRRFRFVLLFHAHRVWGGDCPKWPISGVIRTRFRPPCLHFTLLIFNRFRRADRGECGQPAEILQAGSIDIRPIRFRTGCFRGFGSVLNCTRTGAPQRQSRNGRSHGAESSLLFRELAGNFDSPRNNTASSLEPYAPAPSGRGLLYPYKRIGRFVFASKRITD